MLTAIDQLEQYQVGDVVTPKTGGPRMTVTLLESDALPGDWLMCQWFDEYGELRQEKFLRDSLVRQPRSISPGLVHLRRYTALMGG